MAALRPSLILILAGVLGAPAISFGADLELPRTEQDFVIDGTLDEGGWDDALRIAIDIETRPAENVPAQVRTTAYLVEDGSHLYVAFDAEDPQPAAIRAFLRDRDSAWDDDFVGIVIDTYGDERRAFEFFANPLGVQMDLTNDDIRKNEDDSWDAIWDSAGRINVGGYAVEMKIPLNQLRFPRVAGTQNWGVDLLRFYPREHRYRLSNNRLDRDINCYLCQLVKVRGLAGVEPGRDLEVVPTLTAVQPSTTDEPGIEPLRSGNTDVELGISARWGITPDTTVNFAINPDFSQVEADVAQLDINEQFALFFQEKRPFFREGADDIVSPIQAVFTRSVAEPNAGAKLTGKRGRHTYGAYVAEDERTNLILPGAFGSDSETIEQENRAFVARYSFGFGQGSSAGGLVTARNGSDYRNTVGGVDLRWKISDHHSLLAQHLRSRTEYPDILTSEFDQPGGPFSGDATWLGYDYVSRKWFGYLRHKDFGDGFRADSGFVPRVGYAQQIVGLRRTWYGDDDAWITQTQLRGDWDITHDHEGRLLEREIEAYFRVSGGMQSEFELGGLSRDVLFDDTLFKENKISVSAEFQPIGGLRAGIWARWGDQIDFANTRLGDQVELEPVLKWNVSRHLLLRYQGNLVKLDRPEGPDVFDAAIHDLRLTW